MFTALDIYLRYNEEKSKTFSTPPPKKNPTPKQQLCFLYNYYCSTIIFLPHKKFKVQNNTFVLLLNSDLTERILNTNR